MRLPKLKAPPKYLNIRNCKKFDLEAFRKDMVNVPFDEIEHISSDANVESMEEIFPGHYY